MTPRFSLAVDGREERDQVDYRETRKPAIEISRSGPCRAVGVVAPWVRGGMPA